MKRPWKVKPVHPALKPRTYGTAERANEAAHELGRRYGVSVEVLFANQLQYEVRQLEMAR
jgi:hypothetical protein